MAARLANWVAIALGGTGGTFAALFGGPPANGPQRATGVGTANALSAQVESALPAVSSDARAPSPHSDPVKPAALEPASAAYAAALLTTRDKLLRAEMRCDLGKPDSCLSAARSYESGSAGSTDPVKAAKYRRIALTMWISRCDHNSAVACIALGKLYRAGEGVPQSDRNADALVLRALELCRYSDKAACSELTGSGRAASSVK